MVIKTKKVLGKNDRRGLEVRLEVYGI